MNNVEMLSVVDWLLEKGVVKTSDIEQAEAFHKKYGGRIEDILLSQGACAEDDVLSAKANIFDLPRLNKWLELKGESSVNEVSDTYGLNTRWWIEQAAFPLGELEGAIWVALKDVQDEFVASVLIKKTGKQVQLVIVGGHELRQLQGVFEESDPSVLQKNDPESLRDLATGAPIIHFVNDIIQRAIDAKGSDIHFESYRGIFRVRVRVDGVLHEIDRPGIKLQSAIISRLKLMANLDISEKRLPQDGSIRTRVSGKDLDIRVATTPGVAGESVVLRLLDRIDGVSNLADLNLFDDQMKTAKKLLSATSGIVLVTGPTGSGKTTSLYAFLNHLAGEDRKIITVEDPVEYQTAGITQIQVHSEIGLSFASILRSVLRQDPDIILIGEIRDRETAEIAVQAALTGHLVLTTLHTNDAPSSFVRLMDMGVENYLLATSVIGVLAQRLVRRNCPHCQGKDENAEISAKSLGFEKVRERWPELTANPEFTQGNGCEYCLGTGFRGRRSIFEMFEVNDDIRHVISTEPEKLGQLLERQKMRRLREDGLLRAAKGETTVAEVIRVAG
ncbi:MAG: type II/IV secretion system protein [Pseudomonadales bacterium]|nr:type II/IV secretion system protein [Pseudomonadales bacterium]